MSSADQRIAALSPEQRELLMRRLREKAAPAAPAVPREVPLVAPVEDRYRPVPLTGIQEAYWIGRSGAFDLGGCGANVYLEYELVGSVWTLGSDIDGAARRLVERHEMLRTIVLPDGTQQVLPTVPPFHVQIEDLSGKSEAWIEKHLQKVREAMRYGLFPVDRWPLFDLVVHQLPAGRIRIHTRFDGMLIDGMARNRIIEELTRLVEDPAAELPVQDISFLDHARALDAFRSSATYQRSREYWLERIPSLPPWPVLPVVGEVSPATVPRIAKRDEVLLPAEAWQRLRQRASRLSLTPTGILTAAFAELLRRDNPTPDFSLAVEASYLPPSHPQIREVVGNFATIEVLGIEDDPGVSFAERAQRLQRRLTEDLEHLHFSGHEVLRELNRRRRVGGRAVVPILFDSIVEFAHSSYQGENVSPSAAPSVTLSAGEMIQIEQMIALPQVLLLCVAEQDPDGSLHMITQAVEDVLAPGFVPGLLADYSSLLARLAAEPSLWEARSLFPRQPARAEIPAETPPVPIAPSRPPASWSPVEAELATLWEEVLGQRPETAAADFYELGGDSLRAARLLARVSAHFGISAPLHDFLAGLSLEAMAGVVQSARPGTAAKASLWSRLASRLRGSERSAPTPESPVTRKSASHGMRIFLTLWLGQLISSFGTGLGSFALGVWIYEKTGSTTQFALVGFTAGITVLLIAPIAGALADRWDRRKLLLASDLGSALITFLMASLMLTGNLQPWHVYPVVAAMVGFSMLQGPALTSSISLLVPRGQLARASGMSQMSRSVSQIIGPLLAGALVGRIGYHGIIFIDAATFLFALVTVLLVRIPAPPRTQESASASGLRSLFSDFAAGWTYLRSRTGLLAMLGLFAVTNFSMGMVQVLLTPLILSFATPMELGTVNSAGAVGVLLGSIAIALWGGPRQRIWGILGGLAAQAAVLFLGGLQPSVPLIAIASFFFMITVPVVNACNQVILQHKVAPDVQGRVFAMAGIITSCTVPLAALAAGPLADKVFQPLLNPGGALAETAIGQALGVGPGRGVGLLFITLGVFVILVVGLAFLNPRLRRVESELPDAGAPEPVVGMPPAAEAARLQSA